MRDFFFRGKGEVAFNFYFLKETLPQYLMTIDYILTINTISIELFSLLFCTHRFLSHDFQPHETVQYILEASHCVLFTFSAHLFAVLFFSRKKNYLQIKKERRKLISSLLMAHNVCT